MSSRTTRALLALTISSTLLITACGGDDSSTTSEGGGRPNIYNYAEQLTKFFSKILQRESTNISDTTKKITKKKLGGSIDIPTFHFGGFIDINRL